MRKLHRNLLAYVAAGVIAASPFTAFAQNDAAPAAVTAPEVAPAAPATAPPAPAASAEVVTAAADNGPEAAPEGEAKADDSNEAAIGFMTRAYRAVRDGRWSVFVAALFAILVIASTRGVVAKIPWVGDLVDSGTGGMVYAFTIAMGGALAHAKLAGEAINSDLVLAALQTGGLAVGGWSGIWKQLPWVNKRTDE